MDEIGPVSREARLSFDGFGRLAVVQEGVYAVLNDTVWLNMASANDTSERRMVNVIQGRDHHAYYGTRGSWGRAELGSDGRLHPIPLFPPGLPNWTNTAMFDDLLATTDGVYFGSWNGIGYWDYAKKEIRHFERSNTIKIFAIGDKVFASSGGRPLCSIDLEHGTLCDILGTELTDTIVENSTTLDESHALLSTPEGRLIIFDGKTMSPWPGLSRNNLTGRISALQHLVEGGVAVAIVGQGLFIFTAKGELIFSLTTAPYRLISSLAAREAGVLWIESENAIHKIWYGNPLTAFGERLGLPASWPMPQRWNDRLLVSSDGKLYEAIAGPPGSPSQFQQMQTQAPGGAWAFAARGERMLAGNQSGIYSAQTDGGFALVATVKELIHLVMVGTDLCYAIGKAEIALLQWKNGKWAECAPRIPGINYPAVVHAVEESVWIEMAAEGVARLSCENKQLHLQYLKNPWPDDAWVNLSIVDQTVILTGRRGRRIFLNEATRTECVAPKLQRLLERSPHWILRVIKDETGMLWATHAEGIVTFTPQDGDYVMNTTQFDLGGDLYPTLRVFPGNDIWISTAKSLQHVEQNHAIEPKAPAQPVLVSVMDARNSEELFASESPKSKLLRLPYEQNGVTFRLFSGSYAWRRPPVFQFRLSGTERWTNFDSSSLLNVRELQVGKHLLEVRTLNNQVFADATATFAFEILPPWYRTPSAYALYGIAVVFSLVGLSWSSSYIARRRNRALEKIVHDRTKQLEATMEKLNDETRNAATLAERDRLAGEIHDSLQQGLSGAILQLDTTLKMPAVAGNVRSRLNVVRNMVSYARNEVQHAVWDMESPLLDGTELGDAFRKLTVLINSGTAKIETVVSGTPSKLPGAIKHHLLRIAQEATTNAVRHAQAQRITIALRYEANVVLLAISDDGIGFFPQDALSNKIGHFGLRGLSARAKKLGGELSIESSKGNGTLIRVVAPILREPVNPSHGKTVQN